MKAYFMFQRYDLLGMAGGTPAGRIAKLENALARSEFARRQLSAQVAKVAQEAARAGAAAVVRRA